MFLPHRWWTIWNEFVEDFPEVLVIVVGLYFFGQAQREDAVILFAKEFEPNLLSLLA